MPSLCFQSSAIFDFDTDSIDQLEGVISTAQTEAETDSAKIDPVTFESLAIPVSQLVVQIVSMGAVTACVTGIFKLLSERQRGKNQAIKIQAGKVKLEIPPGVSGDQLKELITPLSDLLSGQSAALPVITIDVEKKRKRLKRENG